MTKSSIQKTSEYFDKYIDLSDDVDHIEALKIGLQELESIPLAQWKKLGDTVYAPNKWTLKDILLHCTDTERTFAYRALAIARGDSQKMLQFDENTYAENARAENRSWESLLNEAIITRKATIALFESLSDEMLQLSGSGKNGLEYSVLCIAFLIPCHQRWHFSVIKERYLPLLDNN